MIPTWMIKELERLRRERDERERPQLQIEPPGPPTREPAPSRVSSGNSGRIHSGNSGRSGRVSPSASKTGAPSARQRSRRGKGGCST